MTQAIWSKSRTRVLDQDGSKNYDPNNEFQKKQNQHPFIKKSMCSTAISVPLIICNVFKNRVVVGF